VDLFVNVRYTKRLFAVGLWAIALWDTLRAQNFTFRTGEKDKRLNRSVKDRNVYDYKKRIYAFL